MLKNTQPFCRELAGKMHVFAHNGNLKNIETDKKIKLGRYRPLAEGKIQAIANGRVLEVVKAN
jgi:predicted glutamine amidotransferase